MVQGFAYLLHQELEMLHENLLLVHGSQSMVLQDVYSKWSWLWECSTQSCIFYDHDA